MPEKYFFCVVINKYLLTFVKINYLWLYIPKEFSPEMQSRNIHYLSYDPYKTITLCANRTPEVKEIRLS